MWNEIYFENKYWKKRSLQNATKLNLNSKCGEQISQKKNLVIFSKKTRIL
jgi:hypothetical protein